MSEPTVVRRFFISAIALAISAVLLRPQVSSALVTRGDELVARADGLHALTLYRRAAWLDASDGVAVDRVSFTAMMTHDPRAMHAAVELANSYLDRHAGDDVVRFDRAMCERSIGAQRLAELDFVTLARRRHDSRDYTFAGYAALRQSKTGRAERWWRLALALDPTYYPARHALARRM